MRRGRSGRSRRTITIPNLNKETKRVAISSVVLSGERAQMASAVYNATKGKEQAKDNAADPLIQNGAKLIPSVTARLQQIAQHVCVPAGVSGRSAGSGCGRTGIRWDGIWNRQQQRHPAPTASPLISFVSFYQNGAKVMETQPQEVSPIPNNRLQMAPINFTGRPSAG